MPTKHLGPDASKMERQGKKTRIGEENRMAAEFNRKMEVMRAELRGIDAAIVQEQQRIEREKKEAAAAEDRKRNALRAELDDFYGRSKLEGQLRHAEEQLERSNGIWGRLLGRQAHWKNEVDATRQNLANVDQREAEAAGRLERQIEEERRQAAQSTPSPALPRQEPEIQPTGPPREPDPQPITPEFEKASTDNAPPEPEREQRMQEAMRRFEEQRNAPGRDMDGPGRER